MAALRSAPAILILAAGASRRMRGRDKLLEEIDGMPLLARAARAALAVAADVTVALPAGSPRRACLEDWPVRMLDVDERAMSASIRAGVRACTADALLLHLADMPEIDADAFRRVVSAWQRTNADVLRATDADGTPGQPVVFGRALFPKLMRLRGDVGAREVLRGRRVAHVALEGAAATTDLDTPEAWAAWRARRG